MKCKVVQNIKNYGLATAPIFETFKKLVLGVVLIAKLINNKEKRKGLEIILRGGGGLGVAVVTWV